MPKDLSPEERLLRLIRSKAPKEAPAALPAPTEKPRQEAAAPSPIPVPVLAPTPALVIKPAPAPAPAPPPPRKLSLDLSGIFHYRNLNLALVILLVVLLAYFMPAALRNPKGAVERLDEKIKAQERMPAQKETPVAEAQIRPPFDYFSGQAASRNIFAPVAKEEPQAAAPKEEGPKLEEVKAQLSLLGVIGGASPQVIIEDKRTQKTYFLNKGSSFDDIEVDDILENKVILIYKGKQFELVL